jgi:thiamine kinase-like enzyme
VAAINRLRQIPCPDLPVKEATQRWAAYVDGGACAWLDGDVLLHTDFNPLNVLITQRATWSVDWAWPTRGAAFIDPACFLLRLMASGHSAADAEGWAAQCAGWDQAPVPAINAFALASARLFAEIARDDPQPWKRQLAGAAGQWLTYRATARAKPGEAISNAT